MTKVGVYDQFPNATYFVVKNITQNKRVRVFQYPIKAGETRDLLAIPGISEADLRHSLLKGTLFTKLKEQELEVMESNVDLLQFSTDHKAFLAAHGISIGLEVSGSSIPAAEHKVLRQLIHLAETGPFDGFGSAIFREILPSASPFPTSIIWYESSAKLKKIVEKEITYNGINLPTMIVWRAYDVDGSTVVASSFDSIVYSGAFEISRTRTFS